MSLSDGRHHSAVLADEGVVVTEILWRSEEMTSMEHCVVLRREDGWTIGSTTVLPISDEPGHVVARIRTDGDWSTVVVVVDVHGPATRHLQLVVQHGEWYVDGRHRPDLAGCRDVDLGWTPATNLLPVRRLGLGIGEEATIDVAWLRFPAFELERVEQTYQRLEERVWRYRSGAADFVLEVDDLGLVTRYGDDLWTTVASAG